MSQSDPLMGGDSKHAKGRLSELLAWIKVRAASPASDTYLCIAVAAGVVCGLVAYVYSSAFEFLLRVVWEVVPEKVVLPLLKRWSAVHLAWVFTVAAATFMGTLAGLTQRLLGFPGDLPDTVECIHHKVRQATLLRATAVLAHHKRVLRMIAPHRCLFYTATTDSGRPCRVSF